MCRGNYLNFKKAPTRIRVWPPPGTDHSTPLKAACPSHPPFPVYLPNNEKPYLVCFYSSNRLKEYTLCDVDFSGLKEKDPLCLVLARFKDICLPSFYICLFVLSSTCLTVRTKRIVELMNVLCCYYLLACACMNLLFLCLGRGWGGGAEGQKPWFKKKRKKKIRSKLYTM